MTKDQLDAIRERLARARPPRWDEIHSLGFSHEMMEDGPGYCRDMTGYCDDAAAFIIAAHNEDIPSLLAFVDEQAKTIATLEQVIHDIDISGEANYGAEQERKAILEILNQHYRDRNSFDDVRHLIGSLCSDLQMRGSIPQDAPPPAKLRERVAQLEAALREAYSLARHQSSGYARQISIITEKALEGTK